MFDPGMFSRLDTPPNFAPRPKREPDLAETIRNMQLLLKEKDRQVSTLLAAKNRHIEELLDLVAKKDALIFRLKQDLEPRPALQRTSLLRDDHPFIQLARNALKGPMGNTIRMLVAVEMEEKKFQAEIAPGAIG